MLSAAGYNMAFLDDLLKSLGAINERAHLFTFTKASAPGVSVRWERDGRPAPATGLLAGDLLEIHAVLDERHDLGATPRLRFDVLEEDFLLFGGLDDRVISLVGDGAQPPEAGAPVRAVNRTIHELAPGESPAAFIEEVKRTATRFGEDYGDALVVLKEVADPARDPPGTNRTHVVGWHRVAHDDIGAVSELYAVLDVDDGRIHAASPVVEVGAARVGTAVRIAGQLVDAEPLDPAVPEPLDDVTVTLAGRRAVTGSDGVDDGRFVIDARLDVGDHELRIARPGVEPTTLTVRVSATAAGVVTAAVRDGGTQLVAQTTPNAATAASLLALALPNPVAVRVHKVRGTVLWPDSRPGDVPPDYRGTPLADRRVYVLPLPATGTATEHRPTTTAAWEALARRPEVLRSARPGRAQRGERTGDDGRFEVKYVDLTPGARHLVWVTRPDPVDAAAEAPDHVVRTLRLPLRQLWQAALATAGVASSAIEPNRLLVDHEYNLTSDTPGGRPPPAPRNVVAYALDLWRAVQLPAGRRLVRPRRGAPAALEPVAAPVAGAGEELAVPASRVVDGVELQVLPLVLLDEPADAQGGAARRARTALMAAVESQFPTGADAGAVRWALDATRAGQRIDIDAGVWDATHDVTVAARVAKLLESTFVVRDQLGAGRRLRVDQARWHVDAVSLADTAWVQTPAVNGARAAQRSLAAGIVPVLGAVSPLLPALAVRGAYVMPGHGLWAQPYAEGSNALDDWISNRGGYRDNAGEDEVDCLLAREVVRIAGVNGGATLTTASREVGDLTRAGVQNTAAAPFFADQATPEFPRLWQQNAFYALGLRGLAVGGLAPHAPPPHPPPPLARERNRDKDGANSRIEQARTLAAAGRTHAIFSPHTNALNGASRGGLVEYLNAEPAGGGATDEGAASGNPLGFAFATRLLNAIVDRCHVGPGKLRTMRTVGGGSVADLTRTLDHGQLALLPNGDAQDRRVADGPLAAVGTKVPPPPAAATHEWRHNTFRDGGGNPVRIPVALSELAFHDNDEDAALLSRAWFRRLAGEAMATAIDEQLRDAAAPVTQAQLRDLLARLLGETLAVAALPGGGAAAPADVRAALRATADPGAAAPASAALGPVVTAALGAARSLTREALVARIRDELRKVAGWEDADEATRAAHPDDNDLDRFVTAQITDGAPLARPASPVTRVEAGALACTAIGLSPASLRTAETTGVGSPAAPLLRPANAAPGTSAYLGRVEGELLAGRLRALGPQDVHRVADAWLGDAAWQPLGRRPGDVYELDPGTPLVVVFRTAGAAWKTVHQADPNRLDDVEIRVYAPFRFARLGCVHRDGRRVASATWLLDLPPADAPVDVSVELWVRHRQAGLQRVGRRALKVRVLPATLES